ncbi:MAG TPA: hypothetical protein CFH82_10175 [Sulfurospirillum sp. UBA12182]|nr:MAG TPA: hypothetical protein CFH82_10175 [Sulfurospirillum sp. UBA12182]
MYLKLMHKFLLILSTLVLLNAEETFMVDDFEATLFSKASGTLQVQGSFIFEGRDVDIYDFKIIDALNVVIGSFYAEDLLTSKGKEAFKTTLIKYVQEKYALDIDTLYIQKLKVLDDTTAQKIIEALKKEGCCK